MKRKDLKVILIYAVMIIAIVFFLSRMFQNSAAKPATYDQVVQYFSKGEVAEFVLGNDNVLTLTLNDEAKTKVTYEVASLSLFHADLGELITQQEP